MSIDALRRNTWIVAAALLVAPAAALAAPCDSLTALALPNTNITMAQAVAAGAFVPPSPPGRGGAPAAAVNQVFQHLPAFCRVAMSLHPSADSDIKVELWMPAANWNGKFVVPGNGGYAGSIPYATLATNLQQGYATAMTDTGHEGGSGSFMLDHPEKTRDFADRAVHEMTVKGKTIVAAFYGNGPKYLYFNGCSTGGRQALTAAQRFPDDFDGIVGGAPSIYNSHQTAAQLWYWNAIHDSEASLMSREKLAVLHNAVLQACDMIDGVKDGVLEDPRRCKFDPKVVQCKDADGPNCLTAPQVEAARKVYAGPKDPNTGKPLHSPLFPGSEMGWPGGANDGPVGFAIDLYRYLVKRDANWDSKTINYDTDVALALKNAAILNAVDPDLKRFVSHGKLIMYQGWAEQGIPPGFLPEYYTSVVSTVGAKSADNAVRLFMVPGMGHCRGGDGTDTFDMLAALERWVEQGQAPQQILASKVTNGHVVRTRPLCSYPQVATYKGAGSTDDAANFVCAVQKQ